MRIIKILPEHLWIPYLSIRSCFIYWEWSHWTVELLFCAWRAPGVLARWVDVFFPDIRYKTGVPVPTSFLSTLYREADIRFYVYVNPTPGDTHWVHMELLSLCTLLASKPWRTWGFPHLANIQPQSEILGLRTSDYWILVSLSLVAPFEV